MVTGDCDGVAIPIGLGYYLRSKSITKNFLLRFSVSFFGGGG